MILNLLIPAVAIALACWIAFSKRLATSSAWKATVTPLASIMGSGFLISAPLLGGLIGIWALAAMAGLLVVAYLVGSAIRFNIKHFEPVEHHRGVAQSVAFVSRIALVLAYFISVVYYLELLSAFALRLLNVQSALGADLITSALLVLIALLGIMWGLDSMEKVERFTVALNLGMIGSLLMALLIHNAMLVANGQWSLPPVDSTVDTRDIRVLLGLLIVVQGFETSRYLGAKHPAEQRIATMRNAQLISGGVYLLFVGLATVLFHGGMGVEVTAILGMTKPIAWILPILLTVAALGSQFSAAVADTAGAGGLIEDITEEKIPERWAYGIILAVTLGVAWLVNVHEVIALASRAFALFYALQCVVAFLMAQSSLKGRNRVLSMSVFGLMALICLAVFVLGLPAEG